MNESFATERIVLGTLTVSDAALRERLIAHGLDGQVFADPRHRLIYEAMLRLHTRGLPVDVLTVPDDLTRTGDLQAAGGTDYIEGLQDHITSRRELHPAATILIQRPA
jgi:replicative DNA helicase